MFLKRAAVIAAVVLALAVAGFAFWLRADARPVSDPSRLRSSPEYERALAPGTYERALAPGTYERALAPGTNVVALAWTNRVPFRVEEAEDSVRLISPIGAASWSDLDFEPVHRVDATASHSATIPGGLVELAYIGIAYTVPRTNFDWAIELPASFYKPDGKKVPAEETTNATPHWERDLRFTGLFPAAAFYFVGSNLAETRPLKLRVFDARTKADISGGSHGRTEHEGRFWFEAHPRIWHQAPLEVILTLAAGPVEVTKLLPIKGAEATFGGGAFKLIHVAESGINGFSSSGQGRSNVIAFRFGQPLRYEKRRQTSFVFEFWPPGACARTELEFYDGSGTKLEGGGGYAWDSLVVSTAIAEPDEVKEIRLKCFPNTYRVTFLIPELPGLPEENRNAENLFDIRIPYVRFQREHDLQSFLGGVVQMSLDRVPLTYPNGYFPTVRTNVTPGDLLMEVSSLLSRPDYRLIVDPETNRIEFRPSPVRVLIEQVKSRIGM